MTNNMIILLERVKLMEAGIIGSTGETFTTDDGTVLEMPEPIHTYQAWKELGYQVNKGEKAVATFVIWKKGKDRVGENGENIPGKIFAKNSAFFKQSQVSKIENR